MTGRVGHLFPSSGASGDMILGAAIDAGADLDRVRSTLALLGLDGWRIADERVLRGDLAGRRVHVEVRDDSARTWRDIAPLLQGSALPPAVRDRSLRVFEHLATVEATLHGVPVDHVHFHEVGALDAILDIVGGCAALEQLGCDAWTASPVTLGSGTTAAAHGALPVPSPATLELLRGVPVVLTDAGAELCTPTGAAMLVEWVDRWTQPGSLVITRVGYGAGARDTPGRPNLLRLLVAEAGLADTPEREPVVELRALIDDLSPELLAEAAEDLRGRGALDVWTTQAATKKGRTATALTCLCRPQAADDLERRLYATTSTLGIRRAALARSTLDRQLQPVEVAGQTIRVKVSSLDGEVMTAKPEYEDCVAAATVTGQAVRRVHEQAVSMFWAGVTSPVVGAAAQGSPARPQ